MKCRILFSGKNKKYINLSFAELAYRVVKVKEIGYTFSVGNPRDQMTEFATIVSFASGRIF